VARAETRDAQGDLIVVGEVTRAHGVRGDVRVVPLTDFPEHLLVLEEVVLVSGRTTRPARVERAEAAGQGVLMKFAGIDTLAEAQALRGATIQIPSTEAAPLPPGQYYTFQVVGLEVRTPEGQVIGRLVDVLRTGSNDVYVVQPAQGREVLLPAIDSVVCCIDIAAGTLVARLPEWIP
jgi:16S rRNA processing protein RimM